jgi:glycosyltransferase involved in cell wall biosynthesis
LNPMVSVVITTYNRAHLVPRAIQSVLSQTFADFELIVVDNGSVDNTREAVACLSDPRMRYVRLEQNRRISGGRNVGISKACGDYIALLDSDDEWLPTRLAEQLDQARDSETRFDVFYCHGYVVTGGIIIAKNEPAYEGNVRRQVLQGWIPHPSQTLIRRSILSHEPFDESIASYEDSDLMLRLSKITEFRCLRRRLVRCHESVTNRICFDYEGLKRGVGYLEKKWQPKLSSEEQELFQMGQQERRKVAATVEFAQVLMARPSAASIPDVRQCLRVGVEWQRVFRLLLDASLPTSLYQAVLLCYYKMTGEFVSRYQVKSLQTELT